MLQVENIGFHYGEKPALQNISFSVAKNSFCSIVGPNGSGKTTFIRLLTGERSDYSGNIFVAGKLNTEYSIAEFATIVSTVPQNMSVQFPYTCLEMVMLGREPHKNRFTQTTDEDLAIVETAMRETATLDYAKRLITELSGGERQRIFLAKALAQEPQLLILDESFANMDMYYSLKCLELLLEKTKQKKLTVLSVMHDLNLVSQYSDAVLMFHNTKLLASGETNIVMTPANIQKAFSVQVVSVGKRGLAVMRLGS